MKKSRYTETQIIKVLKEVEGGRLVKEVCREYGISDATYIQLEGQVRWHGGIGREATERAGGREPAAETHVR